MHRVTALITSFCFLLLAAPFASAGERATWEDLELLEDMLDDDDATNNEIEVYMRLVVDRAKATLPADADADAVRNHEKFRAETISLLLEALDETHLDRRGQNVRDPVNRAAGPMLAVMARTLEDKADRKRLTRRILHKIKRLDRVRHPVHAEVYEGAFRALAATGSKKGLSYLMDNHLHTRKRAEDVAQLRAAMRAMRTYDHMEPSMRLELAEEMVKLYLAMEDLANTSTTDVSALAAKRFWDSIRTDAIPLLQFVTGFPTGSNGSALATVADFRAWLRQNDNPRKEPWTKPLRRADEARTAAAQ